MSRIPTLIDAYGGFFDVAVCGLWGIHQGDLPPWADTDLNNVGYDKIDAMLATYYGDRPVSKYVANYLGDGGTLSIPSQQIIAEYVRQIFYDQWKRLTDDFTAEYNPVENYSMSEHEESSNTASGTDTARDSYTDYKETQKQGHTVTSQTDTQIYGFNSQTASDADAATNTTTFGAADDTGDTLEITGTKQNTLTHGKVDTFERDFSRSGNIGVMTATQMLDSDITFWTSNNFFQKICADIASILTIPIYE